MYLYPLQQEVFRARKKRDKKARHGGDVGLDDERLEAELSLIQRPQLADTLPCVIFRFAVRVITGIPSSVQLVIEWYYERQTTTEEESQDESGGAVCACILGCIKKIKVVRLSCLGCQFVSLVDTLLL